MTAQNHCSRQQSVHVHHNDETFASHNGKVAMPAQCSKEVWLTRLVCVAENSSVCLLLGRFARMASMVAAKPCRHMRLKRSTRGMYAGQCPGGKLSSDHHAQHTQLTSELSRQAASRQPWLSSQEHGEG